jgi:ABC-type spermidine/putrescine transport system permease subunit I
MSEIAARSHPFGATADVQVLRFGLFVPNVLFLTIILLAPLGIVAGYSFFTYSSSGVALPVFTFANYARLGDPYYTGLILRTAEIALKTTLICVVLSYPVAYFLARASRVIAVFGLLLLLTPLMVSAVVRAFGWLVLLGRNGIVNSLLIQFGFNRIEFLYSETAVLIGLVHLFLPFMVLPLMSSIERISSSVEEAARNLGASPFQVFSKVILPLSMPGLISGSLLVFVEATSAFVMPALLGGRNVRMVGNQVYDEMLTSFNLPGASMLTVSLVVFALGIIFLGTKLARPPGLRS